MGECCECMRDESGWCLGTDVGGSSLALLPGTEAQVRDHAKNWNMPFGEEETMDGVTN